MSDKMQVEVFSTNDFGTPDGLLVDDGFGRWFDFFDDEDFKKPKKINEASVFKLLLKRAKCNYSHDHDLSRMLDVCGGYLAPISTSSGSKTVCSKEQSHLVFANKVRIV